MADQTLPIEGALDLTPPASPEANVLEIVARVGDNGRPQEARNDVHAYVRYSFYWLAGLKRSAIRIQLAVPDSHFLAPQILITACSRCTAPRWSSWWACRFVFGFANYIIPLQIGARDMAFPRLNAFSFWMTPSADLLLYYSFIGGSGLYGVGNAPDVAWWAYAPLTARAFSPGNATDYWALWRSSWPGSEPWAGRLTCIATAISMRCKGMTLMRMPLFTWLLLVVQRASADHYHAANCCADHVGRSTVISAAHFFDTQAGGSAVVWMHFFWIFGHPEVYVLVFPAFAIASEVIPVFSRKAIFGYPAMVAASVGIAFVSLGVWAHHMFTVGMTSVSTAFFVLSTMLVGVPTGIKIFNWLATMWGGKIRFRMPMLFCTAFLFQFLVGGAYRHHAVCRPMELAVAQLLFRHRAFSLHTGGRYRIQHFCRNLLLVSPRRPAA